MSTPSPESIGKLAEELSDTKSWTTLANELNSYLAKMADQSTEADPSGGETLELSQLVRSLGADDEAG